jgi:hypothetical protein
LKAIREVAVRGSEIVRQLMFYAGDMTMLGPSSHEVVVEAVQTRPSNTSDSDQRL